MAPYTKYYLDFAPFGYIDIDPSDFVYSNAMVFDISVDLISGLGTLRIQDTAGNNNPVYGLYTSQVGVPMTLSANTQNIPNQPPQQNNSTNITVNYKDVKNYSENCIDFLNKLEYKIYTIEEYNDLRASKLLDVCPYSSTD
jgi:hypothetical protein